MSLAALGLLVLAAGLHAGWNLLLKQAADKYIITWWALLVGAVLFVPLLGIGQPVDAAVWPYAFGSAMCHALYFLTLATAYGRGDFSLVYPIARGSAPALLAVWSFLFLHERLHGAGVVGLALLVLGLIVVGSSAWWTRQQRILHVVGVALAFLVAGTISLYSLVDGAAVRLVSPAFYIELVSALTALVVAPLVFKRYGWTAVRSVWQGHWRRILVIGVLTFLAYLLVLIAYALGPVSYVGAIREISIVFAAIIGWWWLNERFGRIRFIGSSLMFAGLFIIALAG